MDTAALLNANPQSMKLGDVVDGYKVLNQLRLAMAKEVEAVEAVERAFKEHMIQNLDKNNEKGVFGLKYKAVVTSKRIPKIMGGDTDGWHLLHEHIYQTGEFDLLEKRINAKAVMDRLEAGVTLPGIETMLVPTLSVTKI